MPGTQRKPTDAEMAATDLAAVEDAAEPEELDDELDLDLDALLPAEAEATRAVSKIRVNGRLIEFPLISKWPMVAIRLADTGDVLGALEMVLDDDDAEFVGMLPADKANPILEHLMKVSGVTPGESSGSANGSRSTAKKRKRT